MTKLIKTTDLPSTLDALEMMEVKGGTEERTNSFCISRATVIIVHCEVKGSGQVNREE